MNKNYIKKEVESDVSQPILAPVKPESSTSNPPESDTENESKSVDDSVPNGVKKVVPSTLLPKPDPSSIKSIICKPKIPITIEETIAVDLVEKPRRDHWFQVRPFDLVEAVNCWPVNIFEYEHAGELGKTQYLVDRESDAGKLLFMHDRLKPAVVVLGMYFHFELFAWCVKTPTGSNRNADKWANTRVQCAMRTGTVDHDGIRAVRI